MMSPAKSEPKLRRVIYKRWDAWQLESGPLALFLVPQIGGRIMGMQWHGQELSFVNPNCEGRIQDTTAISDVHACKRQLGFLLWGGEKTWLAPQSRWTDNVPFIDLDSGPYELRWTQHAPTVNMISPICRETGVQVERTIVLDDTPGHWTMRHTLRNLSIRQVTWAPWSVAMMLRPATVFLNVEGKSSFPCGLRTFDDEGVSSQVRDHVVAFTGGVAAITCNDPIRFKFGADAAAASVIAVMETGQSQRVAFRKKVPTYHPQPYAHGCVIEVFNSEVHPYYELEVHGPVVTLSPGESFTINEDLAFLDWDIALDDTDTVQTLF